MCVDRLTYRVEATLRAARARAEPYKQTPLFFQVSYVCPELVLAIDHFHLKTAVQKGPFHSVIYSNIGTEAWDHRPSADAIGWRGAEAVALRIDHIYEKGERGHHTVTGANPLAC